jgi:LacI family transcriptional regulator
VAQTIYDIAKKAGVSITTVSRVLNGKGEITLQTREKVQRVVDEMGYAPSQLAKGLAGKFRKTIGIVALDMRELHHATQLFQAERSLTAKGYSCIVYSMSDQLELCEHLDRLNSYMVDGIVFTGSIFATSPYKEIIREKITSLPCVVVNASIEGDNFYGVICEARQGFHHAVDFLVTQKRRRHIAFMCGRQSIAGHEKLMGYREGMTQNNLAANMVEGNCQHDLEDAKKATGELMRAHPETDAILFPVDITAAGGIHALLKMGLRVPEDVAVIGANNSDYARICVHSITSADPNPYATGKLAAETLIDAIEGRNPPKLQYIPYVLVEREST